MDYADAVAALERALVFGIHPSLNGIRSLSEELGRPQDSFDSVQVTGTNGKSSTTRLVSALLTAHGVRTAAYTSPHLESYTERVEIDGTPAREADFALALVAAYEAARGTGRNADDYTEFELLTAGALWLMRERDVQIACLEVGMGGRWDATSVVDPVVAVITGVGLDHTERLGATVEAIAEDKAQIIKEGSRTILGPGTLDVVDIFRARAHSVGSSALFVAEEGEDSPLPESSTVRFVVHARPTTPGGQLVLDVTTPSARYAALTLVAPGYQAANVATAVAAAESALGRPLDERAARAACASLRFPGRFELVESAPPLIIDGAHNPQAAAALAGAIIEAWPDPERRPWALLGVLGDKDAEGIIASLAPAVGGFVATQPVSPRALDAGALAAKIAHVTGRCPEISAALGPAIPYARARAGDAGLVITGSLYTAGQARAALHAQPDSRGGQEKQRPRIVEQPGS